MERRYWYVLYFQTPIKIKQTRAKFQYTQDNCCYIYFTVNSIRVKSDNNRKGYRIAYSSVILNRFQLFALKIRESNWNKIKHFVTHSIKSFQIRHEN